MSLGLPWSGPSRRSLQPGERSWLRASRGSHAPSAMGERSAAWAALGISLLMSGAFAWHIAICEAYDRAAWACCVDAGEVC